MNRFYILLTCLLFGPCIQAQEWELGVKGGLNIAKVRIVNDAERSSKVGAHFGGFARTALQQDLDIQAELQLSFQGWDGANITYVNIPVLARYYLVQQFAVFGGPYVGFLVGDADGRKQVLDNTDLGLNLGAEYQVTEFLGIGGNYLVGFTDILDEGESNRKFRNRVFQLYVSYRLNP